MLASFSPKLLVTKTVYKKEKHFKRSQKKKKVKFKEGETIMLVHDRSYTF